MAARGAAAVAVAALAAGYLAACREPDCARRARGAVVADAVGAATGTAARARGLAAIRETQSYYPASTAQICEQRRGGGETPFRAAAEYFGTRRRAADACKRLDPIDGELPAWALAERLAVMGRVARKRAKPRRKRVAVIGGGPVGLLHGVAAARAGANVVVFERRAPGPKLYSRRVWFDLEPRAPGR